jgi:SAM-dependent methyltransferase
MKSIAKMFFTTHPVILRMVIRIVLRLHNRTYALASNLSSLLEDGVHPKHRLTAYHDFFLSNIKQGETALDVGCGKGELLSDIAVKTGARTVGIEINGESVNVARHRTLYLDSVEIFHGDVWATDCHGPVDVITLSNVLEHLTNRKKLLAHLMQSYSPSRILVRVPMCDRDWLVPYKSELGVDSRLDETHEIEYTFKTFEQELDDSDLVIQKSYIRWGELYAVLVRSVH